MQDTAIFSSLPFVAVLASVSYDITRHSRILKPEDRKHPHIIVFFFDDFVHCIKLRWVSFFVFQYELLNFQIKNRDGEPLRKDVVSSPHGAQPFQLKFITNRGCILTFVMPSSASRSWSTFLLCFNVKYYT